MPSLYEKSLVKLELNQILVLLSEYADSKAGKAACLCLKPNEDLDEVQRLLAETGTAIHISSYHGYPRFIGLKDVTDSLELAERGGCLRPAELLDIAGLLRCARTVKSFVVDDTDTTILDTYFSCLVPNRFLEDSIFSAILSEEEIADAASSELADIRRKIRIHSARIKDSLQKIITSSVYVKFLQEPIITIRQGRYVVPVKSEYKSSIPGLIHDVSSTGSTCFVEPLAAVEANNTLRELDLKEKKEIERILFEFSSEVASHIDSLKQNIATLIDLDVIFAKARYAQAIHAHLPNMNDNGKIALRNARHPLIPAESVVPISLHLGSDFNAIIITGPNTGGKTVTLKTVGLLTLMAECGLHIPADEGSTLSVFNAVLADIGDEQSITQSLSTFSSHMKTIVDIVSQCDPSTLILFDELGAGTDPSEGAALAIALIEHCRRKGCSVVATTHYAELKLYAIRTIGVVNASCEFDVETLRPTYRLLIGIPGKSNAFAISKKLGLSESILKDAEKLIDQNDKDFEDVILQLEQQRKEMEKAKIEAENLRAETRKIKEESERYNSQLQFERDRLLEKAKIEAKQIIDDARRTANAAVNEIKAIKKQLSENADTQGINQRQVEVRRTLNEAEDKLYIDRNNIVRTKPSRKIRVGDTVELIRLGTKASVININKDGTFELQAGILKINAQHEEIYLLEQNNQVKTSTRPKHSGRQVELVAMPSEVDLRGMDSIEAVSVLERYLDEAMRSNLQTVRVIHGKGSGVLRTAVQQSLQKNKFVKSFRLGVYGEGEDGVTIVEFA